MSEIKKKMTKKTKLVGLVRLMVGGLVLLLNPSGDINPFSDMDTGHEDSKINKNTPIDWEIVSRLLSEKLGEKIDRAKSFISLDLLEYLSEGGEL